MGFLSPTIEVTNSTGQQSEFAVTGSSYDEPIPVCYGIHRLAGNVIWADELREERVTDVTTEGGKGGPKTETTTETFRYFIHLAVMFCEGPANAVERIWADGKLIFDIGSNGRPTQSLSGLQFRFYNGDNSQLPDPLIEEFIGEDLTPAYRGRTYIVFDNLPLADFGNRIPAITAEISFSESLGAGQNTEFSASPFENGIVGFESTTYDAFPFNTTRTARFNDLTGTLWVEASGHASDSGANLIIDIATGQVSGVRSRDLSAIFSGRAGVSGVHEPTDTYITFSQVNSGSAQHDYFYRDVDANNIINRGNAGQRILDGVILDVENTPVLIGLEQGNADLTVSGYRAVNVINQSLIGSLARPFGFDSIQMERGRPNSALGPGALAEAWGCWTSNNQYRIVQAVATSAGQVFISEIATINVSDVVPTGTSWNVNPKMAADRVTGSLYFQSTINGQPYVWKFDTDANAVGAPIEEVVPWATPVPFVNTGNRGNVDGSGNLLDLRFENGSAGETSLNNERWAWVNFGTEQVCIIDIRTGALDPVFNGIEVPGIGQGRVNGSGARTFFHWHGPTNTLIGIISDASSENPRGVYRTTFDFSSGADISPRQVIEDICARSGLGPDDVDASLVPTAQPGLRSVLVDDRTSARDALTPLLSMLQIEAFESDFRLKFVPKGTFGSIANIPEDDLIQTSDNQGEPFVRAIVKEEDLPRRVEVVYSDFENAYQEGVQAEERADTTQFSRRIETLEFNGACFADLPRQRAQTLLFSAWVERNRLRSRIPQKYLRLDPGDVVTLQLNNGNTVEGRLRRADIGEDLTMDFDQVTEVSGLFVSNAVGASGDGYVATQVPNTGNSEAFIFDTPLLRDIDSAGQEQTISYWGANGEPRWLGAFLFRQTGPSTIAQIGREVNELSYGVLATAPPDATNVTRFVEESFDITVSRGIDGFVSVTEQDVLNGSNVLLIRQPSGQIEIVQFQDATQISEDTVRVSRLLRGRRGTEPFAKGFSAGDEVFLLTPAAINVFGSEVGLINSEQTFRPVTVGQLYENAEDITYTDTANDLRPYSPVRISIAQDGANGFDISWVRRTRIGGELDLAQAGDIPLSEQSEAYEVDILDAGGSTVLRTLASASETVNYSEADILSDFGVVPQQINVVVYQLSTVVGRGFPGEATLETS